MSQTSWFDDDRPQVETGVYTAKLTNVTMDTTKMPVRVSLEFTLAGGKGKTWLNVPFKETMKWLVAKTTADLGVKEEAKNFAASGKEPWVAFFEAIALKRNSICELDISYREHNAKQYQQIEIISVNGVGKVNAQMSNTESNGATAPTIDDKDELPF